jgi:hypothetical protein
VRIVESLSVPATRTRALKPSEPEWGWDGLAWLLGDAYEVLQVEGERCAFVMNGDTLLVHPDVMADIRAALPVHDAVDGLGLGFDTRPGAPWFPLIPLPTLKLEYESPRWSSCAYGRRRP